MSYLLEYKLNNKIHAVAVHKGFACLKSELFREICTAAQSLIAAKHGTCQVECIDYGIYDSTGIDEVVKHCYPKICK